VLAIGLFRYGLLAAGWCWPWLRGSVPARYWRKVVAVLQGVVLTTYAAGVLPNGLAAAGVALALALLVVSFGTQVLELRMNRPAGPAVVPAQTPANGTEKDS
jgi:phosphatidylglycerophosphate synthase